MCHRNELFFALLLSRVTKRQVMEGGMMSNTSLSDDGSWDRNLFPFFSFSPPLAHRVDVTQS